MNHANFRLRPSYSAPCAREVQLKSAQFLCASIAGSGSERVVKWAAGDAICVWWSSDGNANATAAQAGTSSSFSVAGVVSENYYAGYPASAATALNEGVLTISVPSAQDGTFASANMMAATTTDADRNFAFYNVTGLLKFTVEGNYSSVIFRGAKGEAVVGLAPAENSCPPGGGA